MAKITMKNTILPTLFLAIVALTIAWSAPSDPIIAAGMQPQLSLDTKGAIRLAFGRNDSIFCSTSKNGGDSFSKPAFVGHIPGMHLGMTRGPQLASSVNFSLITAMDKSGNIHSFHLNHTSGMWQYKGFINDIKFSAPEGLMDIAADRMDNFYAVWLDVRQGKENNIGFSSLNIKENKWAKSQLIYISPEGNVCECCQPSIHVSGLKISIMFRNWINGSRDPYLIASTNGGKTFNNADKLGMGSWKLKGCPMDGGGITATLPDDLYAVWQREGVIYYGRPNNKEVRLSKGRSCSIAANPSRKNIIVAFQEGDDVKIIDIKDKKETTIGKGTFLKTIVLPGGKVLCAWEQDNKIMFRKI
ncbi:MAG: hypothetical protein WD426_14500 [Anditalea sp.]